MDASTHTIAALSTPPGRGALAVIRLTGDGAQNAFAGIIREKGRFEKESTRKISVYTVVDNAHSNDGCGDDSHKKQDDAAGAAAPAARPPSVNIDNFPEIIDEVTAVKYDAPRSFTGEEMVEIFCHGGTAVTGKILGRLFRRGVRPAGRGEFSRRAFVNGKIGLLKAIRSAHIVLWVTPADEPLEELERRGILDIVGRDNDSGTDNENLLVVINKIDMASPDEKKRFCEEYSLKYAETSLTEKVNIDKLFAALSTVIHGVTDDIRIPEIIVNERHRDIVVSIIKDLRDCMDNFDREEISAYYLKTALTRLEEFCGHTAGDEILNGIFGKFCIGK